ncbi:hypothetical protein [Streptomyces sp. DW26H14]|uniref:hypothetical protein n=1 Tax=Streptomyces sp. DW26H14 TaxID=3435395 RepID=UPI00403D918B
MRASAGRRGAFAVAAALSVVVGVAGCQSGGGGGSKATGKPKAKAAQGAASPIDAVNAAYKKVSGYRSAKFRMDMTVPGAAAATGTAGAAGTKGTASSTITSSGTLGWNPMVMDMTMQGAALGMGVAGAPTTLHSLTTGTAIYTDMSGAIKNDPEFAKALGSKSWLKTDVGAAAAAGSGSDADSALVDNSLQSNENPAQQLATLVAAPQISRVGSETVDGVKAEHYKGHLTIAQALKTGSNGKTLTAEQREQVADSMRKAGITAEDIDVWIGTDSFPVRTDVKMTTSKGPVGVSEHLSGYSAKAATVKVPAAGQTFTVQDLLKIAQNS